MQQEQPVEERNLKKREEVQAYMPSIPFPQRLQRAKMEEQFSRFLDMFKKIEINIPFAETLAQMPNYAKNFKDILSKKRRFAEEGVVSLATCSAVIKKNLPLKMQDPSSFTIPCTIGNFEFGMALCDNAESKIVEQFVLIGPELINDCKNHISMNENEMNFQYIEAHYVEYLNSSFEIKETILNLKEINVEKSSCNEEKGQ